MSERRAAREALARLIDAYNSKDGEALGELYSDDISLWSSLGEAVSGRDQVLGHIEELFEALPDEHMAADTIVTDGETIVVELTSKGTKPNGDPYQIRFTEVFELEDGRFSQIRTYIDPDVVEAISRRTTDHD